MRTAIPRRPAARRRKTKSRPLWLQFWPVLLGIVATFFAVRAASVLALSGPTALRVLYPYLVVVQNLAEHFSSEQAERLSQWILYGQYPLYGVLWVVASRLLRGPAGLMAVLLLHAGGVAAAILTMGN
jgi:hypothetical protein